VPIQLNCPECPRRLEFVSTTSDDSVAIYRCSVHGEWRLTEDMVANDILKSLAAEKTSTVTVE
jgi:hypothetical protein